MRGGRQASCQITRIVASTVCLAAVVAVHAVGAEVVQHIGTEHCVSSEGTGTPSTCRVSTNDTEVATHVHDNQNTTDEREDHALLLADYYKRLDRPELSLAGWRKVGSGSRWCRIRGGEMPMYDIEKCDGR